MSIKRTEIHFDFPEYCEEEGDERCDLKELCGDGEDLILREKVENPPFYKASEWTTKIVEEEEDGDEFEYIIKKDLPNQCFKAVENDGLRKYVELRHDQARRERSPSVRDYYCRKMNPILPPARLSKESILVRRMVRYMETPTENRLREIEHRLNNINDVNELVNDAYEEGVNMKTTFLRIILFEYEYLKKQIEFAFQNADGLKEDFYFLKEEASQDDAIVKRVNALGLLVNLLLEKGALVNMNYDGLVTPIDIAEDHAELHFLLERLKTAAERESKENDGKTLPLGVNMN